MRSHALMFTLASSLAVASASKIPPFPKRQTVSPDNSCGLTGGGANNGYTCPESLSCCSQYGWCGDTDAYCGDGCQSEFGTCSDGSPGEPTEPVDGRCGPEFGSVSCLETECCSAAGYCGTTDEHCKAPDCLFEYGAACDANKVPGGANTSTIARPTLGNILVGGGGIYPCEEPGTVALTYDDGPGDFTAEMLNLLAEYDAKVTFFLTGVNNNKGMIDDPALGWADIIRRMDTDGHQIASHTWSHADLSAITSAQRKDEMYKLEMAVRNIVGYIPTYMRPPYSSCTEESGCQADLAELKYHVIYFDLDTADYLNTEPDQIQNAIDNFDNFFEGKSPQTDEALAIAHDIHEQTATTLTRHMLEQIRVMGYRAVTVGECLGDPKENWYRQVGFDGTDSSSPTASSTANTGVSTTASPTGTATAPPTTTSSAAAPTNTSTRPGDVREWWERVRNWFNWWN